MSTSTVFQLEILTINHCLNFLLITTNVIQVRFVIYSKTSLD